MENNLATLWFYIDGAARAFEGKKEHSEQLADLVLSIASLGELKNDDGTLIINIYGSIYWKDLPFFRVDIRASIVPEGTMGLVIRRSIMTRPGRS